MVVSQGRRQHVQRSHPCQHALLLLLLLLCLCLELHLLQVRHLHLLYLLLLLLLLLLHRLRLMLRIRIRVIVRVIVRGVLLGDLLATHNLELLVAAVATEEGVPDRHAPRHAVSGFDPGRHETEKSKKRK